MTIQVSHDREAESTFSQRRTARLASLMALRSPLPAAPDWLVTVRAQATARVGEQSIPSTKDEEWRFTDLSPLLNTPFQAQQQDITQIQTQDIAPWTLSETSLQLVFVNGVYAPHLSSVVEVPVGLFISSLSAAIQAGNLPETIVQHLAHQPEDEEAFTLLNTASFTDAAVIVADRRADITSPIHFLFLSLAGEEPVISHPRCLVVAEPGSRLTLVETYASLGTQTNLTNALLELCLQPNAQVHHVYLQQQGSQEFHIGRTAVTQARDSRYTCTAISLGSQLSRHHLDIFQIGEQTETVLNGLTVAIDEQLADTHSTIAFSKPYGQSQQIHKCIAADRARAVFNGKIFVPKPAQFTDASQLSRTLLLSPKARVDTKPQLEIVADNVKCAHGATVSQLEADEVFYLQSRGLDQDTAQKLLVYAFAAEVLETLPLPSLAERLGQQFRDRALASPL